MPKRRSPIRFVMGGPTGYTPEPASGYESLGQKVWVRLWLWRVGEVKGDAYLRARFGTDGYVRVSARPGWGPFLPLARLG